MLPMLIAAGAGAGLGLLKSEFIDKPNELKDREMQALTDRYSPWTGMRGKMVEHTNPLGTAAAMAAQGASMGQGIETAGAQNELSHAIASKLGARGGADQMTAAAVAPGSTSTAESDYQSPLGAGEDPVQGPGAIKLAELLRAAIGNRKMSGIT